MTLTNLCITEASKQQPLNRLNNWMAENKQKFQGPHPRYLQLMENFLISCSTPCFDDYRNYTRDIRDYMKKDQKLLRKGFFIMYGITLAALVLHGINYNDPRRN